MNFTMNRNVKVKNKEQQRRGKTSKKVNATLGKNTTNENKTNAK